MRVLGLDTSTLAAGAALVNNSRLIAEYFIDNQRSHSTTILPVLDSLFHHTDIALQDIDLFCVSAGPGSFTGLRIGLSIMKGFSLAMGKPLVCVPTLEAMALFVAHADKQICPVIDARKEEVYAALFCSESGSVKRITKDMALKPEELCSMINKPTLFLGNGIIIYKDLFKEQLKDNAILMELHKGISVAAQVASLGADMMREGKVDKETRVFYVRPSEAELKRMKQKAGSGPLV